MRVRPLLALSVLLACGDKGDDTGAYDPGTGTPPEVAGTYTVQVLGTTGCENDVSLISWAEGRLDITGTGGALTFDFGDGMTFEGTVDGNESYRFDGDATLSGDIRLDVYNAGSFDRDDSLGEDSERWVMTGTFEIEVDDDEFSDNNCTLESPVEAYELLTSA